MGSVAYAVSAHSETPPHMHPTRGSSLGCAGGDSSGDVEHPQQEGVKGPAVGSARALGDGAKVHGPLHCPKVKAEAHEADAIADPQGKKYPMEAAAQGGVARERPKSEGVEIPAESGVGVDLVGTEGRRGF